MSEAATTHSSATSSITDGFNHANRSTHRPLRLLRLLLLGDVVFTLGIVAIQVALYPALLRQSGSVGYIAEPVVLLIVYAALILVFTWRDTTTRLATLRLATIFGLITGGMWLVNQTIETFVSLPGALNLLATAPLLLGAFLLWGVAGLLRTWQTGSLRSGLLAAVWSAMLCVLITITFGFLLLFVAFGRLQAGEATDPDFLRSRWSDLHAFVIANTFDAAFSHLLGALVVSLVVGFIGALVGLFFASRRSGKRVTSAEAV